MAGPLYYDRVCESSTTTGPGTYTLAGAVSGYQSFAVVGNLNTCYYAAYQTDANGNAAGDWEVGLGTYTSAGTTLTRSSILASSNGGSSVSWVGTSPGRRIALVQPAAVQIASVATAAGVSGSISAGVLTITLGDITPGSVDASKASTVTLTNAATSSQDEVFAIRHNTSGTPAAGFGSRLHFDLQSSTTVDTDAAHIVAYWIDATHATRKGGILLGAYSASTPQTGIDIRAGASAVTVGFFGATPVAQQTGDLGTGSVNLGLFSGTPTFAAANLTGTVVNNVIYLRDEKTAGTQGGTFTSGAWRTRTLNTEVTDTGGHCSLASNQFTLSAGTYKIFARAPANACNYHQARIQNVSAGTTLLTGSSMYAGLSDSIVMGRFTLGSTQTLELQHRCSLTKATDGMGAGGSFGTEVYAEVWLEKEAT